MDPGYVPAGSLPYNIDHNLSSAQVIQDFFFSGL